MSSEIEFGDVEVPRPERGVRPDANPRYAVAACGAPGTNDLSIYVDLDAMIDMEEHALSDDTVELGGVLLGRVYEDDAGKPFVVVADCLRAKHYESTRGSFKFTHDTWSEITRQEDEYADDMRMVGWYHTHPDWGVFLSGMDLFICHHFFNKPLDLALVIDPCRDDRGWFQWPGDGGEPRRTGGFHVFGSRFRQAEIESAAQAWREGNGMFSETRRRPTTTTNAPPGTTIVQVPESGQHAWMSTMIVAALAMQTVLVVAALWRLSERGGTDETVKATVEETFKRLENQEETRRKAQRLEAQQQMLDKVLSQIKDAPEDFTKRLIDAQAEVEATQVDMRAHRAATAKLANELDSLQISNEKTKSLYKERGERIEALHANNKKEREEFVAKLKVKDEEIVRLGGDPNAEAASVFSFGKMRPFVFPVLLSLLIGAGLGAVGVMSVRRNGDDETPAGERDPPSSRGSSAKRESSSDDGPAA